MADLLEPQEKNDQPIEELINQVDQTPGREGDLAKAKLFIKSYPLKDMNAQLIWNRTRHAIDVVSAGITYLYMEKVKSITDNRDSSGSRRQKKLKPETTLDKDDVKLSLDIESIFKLGLHLLASNTCDKLEEQISESSKKEEGLAMIKVLRLYYGSLVDIRFGSLSLRDIISENFESFTDVYRFFALAVKLPSIDKINFVSFLKDNQGFSDYPVEVIGQLRLLSYMLRHIVYSPIFSAEYINPSSFRPIVDDNDKYRQIVNNSNFVLGGIDRARNNMYEVLLDPNHPDFESITDVFFEDLSQADESMISRLIPALIGSDVSRQLRIYRSLSSYIAISKGKTGFTINSEMAQQASVISQNLSKYTFICKCINENMERYAAEAIKVDRLKKEEIVPYRLEENAPLLKDLLNMISEIPTDLVQRFLRVSDNDDKPTIEVKKGDTDTGVISQADNVNVYFLKKTISTIISDAMDEVDPIFDDNLSVGEDSVEVEVRPNFITVFEFIYPTCMVRVHLDPFNEEESFNWSIIERPKDPMAREAYKSYLIYISKILERLEDFIPSINREDNDMQKKNNESNPKKKKKKKK